MIINVGELIFLVEWYYPRYINDTYALLTATGLIMSKIRILSKGYGIPPDIPQFLHYREGISEIITPPRWLLDKKEKKSITDSFDNWLRNGSPST